MGRIRDHQGRGKRVLLRVDLNCPVEEGRITGTARINAHAKTIAELSDRGARVIVLSHQGRKGHDDFIPLAQHARMLSSLLSRPVIYVDQVVGAKCEEAIARLEDGQVLLLENVRYLHCETKHPDGQGEIVYHLSPLVDYFVLDALSVAHRKHSSVIGFSKRMPCFAGDVLSAEIDAVRKVSDCQDVTFIFGGSKADDSFKVMARWLDQGRVRRVLVGGALSVLLLHASGRDVGDSKEFLASSGLEASVPAAKELLSKHDGLIMLPLDVGLSIKAQQEVEDRTLSQIQHQGRIERDADSIREGQIYDIGAKTIAAYSKEIEQAGCIVMNGPLGVYELDHFAKGTREVLEAVSRSKAFSLLGGGHTLTAIDRFGMDRAGFGYVSLAGKALIEFLCGKELPGIRALEENAKEFPHLDG